MGRGKRSSTTVVFLTDNPRRPRTIPHVEITAPPNKLGQLTNQQVPWNTLHAPRIFFEQPLRLHSLIVKSLQEAPGKAGAELWRRLEPFDGCVKPLKSHERRRLAAEIGLFVCDLAEPYSDEPRTKQWKDEQGEHVISYTDRGDQTRSHELLQTQLERALTTKEMTERNTLLWRQTRSVEGSGFGATGAVQAALRFDPEGAVWQAMTAINRLAPERLFDFFLLLARGTSRKPPRQS